MIENTEEADDQEQPKTMSEADLTTMMEPMMKQMTEKMAETFERTMSVQVRCLFPDFYFNSS